MASARSFLMIDGVSGVSTDPTHLNSIELLAWSWGTSSMGSSGGGSGTERPTLTALHFRTEDSHAAHQMFLADAKGTEFKAARLDIVGLEIGVLQFGFKGVTIMNSEFSPTREGSVYGATLRSETGTPIPAGLPARSAGPQHAGLIHEALHGRSRSGRK